MERTDWDCVLQRRRVLGGAGLNGASFSLRRATRAQIGYYDTELALLCSQG